MRINNRLGTLVLLLLVAFPVVGDDACKKCKCTSYPPEKECKDCCISVHGTIKEYEAGKTITVATYDGSREKLTITRDTEVVGTPKNDATVIVVYNKDTRVAGLIRVSD